jgi:hypothetical protein
VATVFRSEAVKKIILIVIIKALKIILRVPQPDNFQTETLPLIPLSATF